MKPENNKKNKIWVCNYVSGDEIIDSEIRKISESLNISEICSILLHNRGYETPEKAVAFLKNEHTRFHDPYLLKDMDKAVDRIREALKNKDKITIYGDYDVDGVTSVSTLFLYLKSLGADVDYYIPSRTGEGYGLSIPTIEKLIKSGVNLIITVDTGITAYEEADFLTANGVDLIITDHHECREELPNALAIVNPHRHDCTYPFTEMAGVGVVFKLLCAYEMMLCQKAGIDVREGIIKICSEYADLAAIGTIADVMPLKDENRIIVLYGLNQIANTKRLGLSELIKASSMGNPNVKIVGVDIPKVPKKRKITSSYIGYGIAPRINAAGRISSASKAVELLLADTVESARALAEELCDINVQRQFEENVIAEKAYATIEQEMDFENDRVIVLADNEWNQGIIGIVSSRITEKYGLPSILISFNDTYKGEEFDSDVGKGSGRGIKGMNLVAALRTCEDSLLRYGGHELAAGLSIERGQLEAFKKSINDYARENLSDESLAVQVSADSVVGFENLSIEIANEIQMLEPFGIANVMPSFVTENVKVQKITSIGAGKHTKLLFNQNGVVLPAVYFGMPSVNLGFVEGEIVDVLYNLDINDFRNQLSLQLIVIDIRQSKEYKKEITAQIEKYKKIKNGERFNISDNVLPSRDDIVVVYKIIRDQNRLGHDAISERMLLSMVQHSCRNEVEQMNYIKLKFILEIMNELKICRIEEPEEGKYHFCIDFKTKKTSIDKSFLLKKLKSQCDE